MICSLVIESKYSMRLDASAAHYNIKMGFINCNSLDFI